MNSSFEFIVWEEEEGLKGTGSYCYHRLSIQTWQYLVQSSKVLHLQITELLTNDVMILMNL